MYVPNNNSLYNAALLGYMDGVYAGISQVPVPDYAFEEALAVAQVFAQEVDALIPLMIPLYPSWIQALYGLCAGENDFRYNTAVERFPVLAAAVVAKWQETVADLFPDASGGAGSIVLSAGTTSNLGSAFTFANSNGVTFGLNNSTITASVGAGSLNFSAGTTSQNLTALVFSNSNGVSFGINGSTVTASVVPSLAGLGALAAGTQTATSGSVVFANSNGVTFGMSGSSQVTASVNALSAVNLSAGTTSENASAFVFSNSNNVSFGLVGSTITALATVASTQGSINLSAGTTSNLASAFTFSNSNGISFGLNGSVITASYVPGGGGSVNFSAGTTSNYLTAVTFANSNGVSFGLNGSVMTATAGFPVTAFSQDADFASNYEIGLGVLSLQRLSFPMNLSATQLAVIADFEGASNATGAVTLSHAVYTMSAGTASLASSASAAYSWASGSGTTASSAYGGASGTRYRSVAVGYSLTPGDYLFGWWASAAGAATVNLFGRAGLNIVGTYCGLETIVFQNGISASSFAGPFPVSVAATNSNYARTGPEAQRQPGVILIGSGD